MRLLSSICLRSWIADWEIPACCQQGCWRTALARGVRGIGIVPAGAVALGIAPTTTLPRAKALDAAAWGVLSFLWRPAIFSTRFYRRSCCRARCDDSCEKCAQLLRP